eukprot:CAMPEP_0174231716 /NCGR_PEP_ID=MMETSP0417-20130205/2170_1 /TAXON_ID=242541 /ORGANISM="Mayorella sp, Strain BSH-02190019" /LENGTH=588 /DNA_ID=CAMNT_0015309645 /DNA_START=149 /DNA_END=1915 /DNA_ORIENTATION=-
MPAKTRPHGEEEDDDDDDGEQSLLQEMAISIHSTATVVAEMPSIEGGVAAKAGASAQAGATVVTVPRVAEGETMSIEEPPSPPPPPPPPQSPSPSMGARHSAHCRSTTLLQAQSRTLLSFFSLLTALSLLTTVLPSSSSPLSHCTAPASPLSVCSDFSESSVSSRCSDISSCSDFSSCSSPTTTTTTPTTNIHFSIFSFSGLVTLVRLPPAPRLLPFVAASALSSPSATASSVTADEHTATDSATATATATATAASFSPTITVPRRETLHRPRHSSPTSVDSTSAASAASSSQSSRDAASVGPLDYDLYHRAMSYFLNEVATSQGDQDLHAETMHEQFTDWNLNAATRSHAHSALVVHHLPRYQPLYQADCNSPRETEPENSKNSNQKKKKNNKQNSHSSTSTTSTTASSSNQQSHKNRHTNRDQNQADQDQDAQDRDQDAQNKDQEHSYPHKGCRPSSIDTSDFVDDDQDFAWTQLTAALSEPDSLLNPSVLCVGNCQSHIHYPPERIALIETDIPGSFLYAWLELDGGDIEAVTAFLQLAPWVIEPLTQFQAELEVQLATDEIELVRIFTANRQEIRYHTFHGSTR